MTHDPPYSLRPPSDICGQVSAPTHPCNPVVLSTLFLVSGAAALIYELVWFQWLQLILGLTTVSLGLILGVFMGGMGLGSWGFARCVPARWHPLRVYAFLELAIAGWAVALLLVGPALADLYTIALGTLGGTIGAMLRGAFATLCLLPPTLLMGATLPAISRYDQATPGHASRLGLLYSCNACGAVVGCLVTGFYLLRLHDIAAATLTGVALNALAAGAAFIATRRSPFAEIPEARGESSRRLGSDSTLPRKGSDLAAAYWITALSGASALGAEVVWTRLLALLMGGTVYTFSILLAVFLIGIGIGSAVGALISKTVVDARRSLAVCQSLLVLGIAWATWGIPNSLPHWPINPALSLSPWWTFQLDLARASWVILPSAILWGTSFPLALNVVASTGLQLGSAAAPDAARWVGGLYAANTLGSILGALGFSLVLVPILGTQGAERGLLLLGIASALVAWWPRLQGQNSLVSRVILTAGVAASLALVIGVPSTPWGLAAYGRYIATYGTRLAAEIRPEVPPVPPDPVADIRCTYLGEGLNGSIAVTLTKNGVRSFHSAGKVQASSDFQDMRLQRMLGHLSALVHGKPESVLVVACGAGVTAGSFVPHPETRRIVICDIEPLVPRVVAPMFARENFNVIADPRTQVVSDDGRHFIRTTRERFDVITSDPIDPWVKGCAALNTVEYYKMCRDHLRPGGVMSLWVPLYESDRETVRTLMASFFEVFPNATLWSNDNQGQGYDTVLLGQVEPTQLDLKALEARLDRPDHVAVRRSMREAGFASLSDLLGTYAGQARDLTDWRRGAVLNTDRNLRLQYLAGWSVNSFSSGSILNELLSYRRYPELIFLGSEQHRRRITASWETTATHTVPRP